MAKYLDKSGVTYLWNKIKGLFTDQSLNTKNKTYAGAINEINTKVGNLTGAFLWKGKFNTLPAVTNYEAGNVVGVGKKEYVLTVTEGTKTWEEFGDEGSYLLKTTAEETYLKKTDGEVKTANLADNAVTSTKLATGARKPIIITGDMTEVDEETYQKLSSDDVDVIADLGEGNFFESQAKFNTGEALVLMFGYSQFNEDNIGIIATYTITINTSAPHTINLVAVGSCDPVPKGTLSSVLEEIDLTGTDADRKAKLDKFETDWKALTGADDLTGARFVGGFGITDDDDVGRTVTGIMTYCAGDTATEANDNHFYGICNGYSFSRQKSQIAVKVSCTDGSLHITPLFSHLEAITIYTDNTPEHMQANLANIAAYEANLRALGVDTNKSPIIPIKIDKGNDTWFSGYLFHTYGYAYQGIIQAAGSEEIISFSIVANGEYSETYLSDIFVNKSSNAKSLEAITIKTNNATASKAANVAAIKAYVDNLKALGVDVTKGYMIPVKLNNGYHGFIMGTGADGEHTGVIKRDKYNYGGGWIFIDNIGTYQYLEFLTLGSYDNLTTTAKTIIPAINEINANAVHSDKLVPTLEAITIKTGNTPEDKAANKAVIEAYRDNLTALGVDVTKGFIIPIKTNTGNGFILFDGTKGEGYVKINNDCYGFTITANYEVAANNLMSTITNYSTLNTTSKRVLPAINEINALAKGKQDKLTSGTNIKTVNGQSLLGSGDIAISGGGDVTAAGDNTFTGNNVFSGITIADILDGTQYQITGDNGVLMFASGATNEDIQLSGVATPTFSNSAANKKYVDDKVAAAGGGSAPVLVDIDDISGSAGDSVPVDVFNKIANAASAKTPIFGYSKLVNGPRTTYEIVPLCVKHVSTTATNGSLTIQFIAENAYNSIGIMKRSDTECSILISSSHPFALDTSVDKSSTRGIQSSAVWKEIHSEPMTVNTATSGVTTLSSTDKHKILCYADSGTQQYNLPPSPVDGETFLFLKVKTGHAITIQSGTGNQNIYDCSSGNSVVSKTIASSTKRKITVTYSSTVGKWFLMADDFLS